MTGLETAAILGLVSTAATAVSYIGQGYSEKKAAEFNAKKTQQESKVAIEQERLRFKQIRGAAEASVGASGITMEGSPVDIMQSNAISSEQQALMIKYGALQQSSILKSQGKNAMTEGYFKAGTTLLSGIAKNYSGGGSTTKTTETTGGKTPVPQFKPNTEY